MWKVVNLVSEIKWIHIKSFEERNNKGVSDVLVKFQMKSCQNFMVVLIDVVYGVVITRIKVLNNLFILVEIFQKYDMMKRNLLKLDWFFLFFIFYFSHGYISKTRV